MSADGPSALRGERLAATVSLVTLSMAASVLLPAPTGSLSLEVFGSPLTITFAGAAWSVLIVAALVCSGVDATVRACPMLPARSLPYTTTFWCLPMLLTVEGLVLVQALVWWGYRLLAAAAAGLLLALVVSAQCASFSRERPRDARVTIPLTSGVYLAALALYLILYGARLRSLVSASGVLLLSAGLALELYRQTGESIDRIWLYGVLTGTAMGELIWALNYTRVSTRVGAAFLLLAFYSLTGLMRQHLWGRLTRRVLIEYSVAGVAGLAMLFILS